MWEVLESCRYIEYCYMHCILYPICTLKYFYTQNKTFQNHLYLNKYYCNGQECDPSRKYVAGLPTPKKHFIKEV